MNPKIVAIPRKAGFVLVSLLATASFAQTTSPQETEAAPSSKTAAKNEVVQLSPFQVNSTRDQGYQSAEAVSATRIDAPLMSIPAFVTVFNEEFLSDINAIEQKDVLIYDPATNQTSEKDDVNIRGFGGNNKAGFNGFNQLTPGNMVANLSGVSRVELLKGPAAILFGTGAYGGTVNRVAKSYHAAPFATSSFLVTSGEYTGPIYRTELELGGPLRDVAWLPTTKQGSLYYGLDFVLQRGSAWGGLKRDALTISPTLTWEINENTSVTVLYHHDTQDRLGYWQNTVHNGDPFGLVLGDGSYRRYNQGLRFWQAGDQRLNKNNLVDVDVQHRFTDSLYIRSETQVEYNKYEPKEMLVDNTSLIVLKDTALMASQYRILPQATKRYETHTELVGLFKTGPLKHNALLGQAWLQTYDSQDYWLSPNNKGGANGAALYNYFPTTTRAEFYANPAAYSFNPKLPLPVDIWDPQGTEMYVPASGPFPPLYINGLTRSKNLQRSYYFTDLISMLDDRLYLQVGDRYTENSGSVLNGLGGTFPNKFVNPNAKRTYTNAKGNTYSVGLVYYLNKAKTITAYGNYNLAFNPQSTVDPDGTTFPPEQGRQKEIGLKATTLGGRMNLILSAYDIQQQNVIANDPNRVGGYHILIDGLHTQGMEANFNGSLTSNWDVFGGYAYTDARNEVTGAVQFQQPRHAFSVFNRFRLPKAVFKGLGLNVGAIYRSDAASQPSSTRGEPAWTIPAYWRFDAGVDYKWRRGKLAYKIAVFVRNLADNQEIFWNATYSRVTTAPGREFTTSISARF